MDPRRPAVPVGIEQDPNFLIAHSDGTFREHYNHIYSDDDTQRIRLGYCCIQCGESVVGHGKGEPFPEECAVCKFPMRSKQSARFAKEFVGSMRVGPSTSIEEELAIAEEMLEREKRSQIVSVPTIVVPRGF